MIEIAVIATMAGAKTMCIWAMAAAGSKDYPAGNVRFLSVVVGSVATLVQIVAAVGYISQL